jgi:iron complex outermembrane receptor protein
MKKAFFIFALIWADLLMADSTGFTEFAGHIFDAADKSAIEGVVVAIPSKGINTKTDINGHFHFINLPRDTFMVFFTKKGYVKEKRLVDLFKKEMRNVTINLFPITYNMPTVYVTDKIYGNKFDEIHEFTGTVEDADMVKQLGATIAATLSNEVGVSMRSMGPAPARPVIRGLGGDRIAMSEDGLNIVDLSAASSDHAVTVDPSTVDKIEILRGPKTLLNTTTTIGGVVNIIRGDVPLTLADKVSATALLYGETVNHGYNGALTMKIPMWKFGIKADGSYRKTGNLYSPGRIIDNTEIENYNYSFGAGFIEDDYSFGAGINEFSSDYGIPGGFVGAHPKGVNISMLKRLMQAKGLFHLKKNVFDVVEVDFGRTYYSHKEFESNGSLGAEYIFKNYATRVNVNHKKTEKFVDGSFGVSFFNRNLELGGYVFTPPTNTLNFSPYLYESIKLGKHYLELGLRYSYTNITPEREDSSNIGLIRQRIFNTVSASVSLMHEITESIFAGVNVSRSTRAPSAGELFSLGPHLAAYSYEVGNPNLEQETGYGTELFTFFRFEDLTASLTGFYNYMNYYIISVNTGLENVQQLLPIYAYRGVSAILYGFEFSLKADLMYNFVVKTNVSYTSAENSESKMPLPFIPPLKGNLTLEYKPLRGLVLAINSDFAADQNRVGDFEEPTAGYVVFNMSAFYSFPVGNCLNTISLSFYNITNQIYRNHLSRIKLVFPESGRNLKLTYKLNI